MIVYFSGTGNSRCAAELLARQLGDDILDAGMQIKAGARGQLCSERPWAFVAPTYGWQMPACMGEGLYPMYGLHLRLSDSGYRVWEKEPGETQVSMSGDLNL